MRSSDILSSDHGIFYRLWEYIDHFVDRLSTKATILISGGGGGASLATAASGIDLTSVGNGYMIVMGCIGVTVSVFIGILKAIQQGRFMWHWHPNKDKAKKP